jgi:3-phenylpropionate/trans-cinnamate dioxygenase ferredoxin reductase subunit
MAVVTADLDVCMGYANCVLSAGDYFDEAEGMVRVLRADVADEDLPRVADAVGACPVMALTLRR